MTAKRILISLAALGILSAAPAVTASAVSAATPHTATVSAVPDSWYHL